MSQHEETISIGEGYSLIPLATARGSVSGYRRVLNSNWSGDRRPLQELTTDH
jgi:hypothetical protein